MMEMLRDMTHDDAEKANLEGQRVKMTESCL